jgi:hypothetical protein
MLNGRTVAMILFIGCCTVGAGLAQDETPAAAAPQQTLEESWSDFLHYTMIGRFDLAKGYAHAILQANPDPVEFFEVVQKNPQGYEFATRIGETIHEAELADLTRQLLAVIDQGRFARRTDARLIVEEIRRLGSTERGKLMATQRLRDAGEYSVPHLLEAMAAAIRESGDRSELAGMIQALPQIGQPAIRPLAAALQTSNDQVKAEILRALGQIAYPQALPYLKYVAEKAPSAEHRSLAIEAMRKIDPRAASTPAAALFFELAEKYYYRNESLAPAEGVPFANVWFWDPNTERLNRVEVDRTYFNDLMCMRCCEWSLKADEQFGLAIGLWLAAFFKAESTGIPMPEYFGDAHADALVYATTAGPEYLHEALARAVNDRDAAVALGAVRALARTAGEKSLMYTLGPAQPVLAALSFPDRAVRYSAAIAIGNAGPRDQFAESRLVVQNLAEALTPSPEGPWTQEMAEDYSLQAAQSMLKLAVGRNPVIDLSLAQPALTVATKSPRQEIQVLAGQILAYVSSPNAQRAIADMALAPGNDPAVRIAAFQSLAQSAKLSGSLLADDAVNAIYDLISVGETDPAVRAAAAAAYGSLNLPSQKVKTLILDQAQS